MFKERYFWGWIVLITTILASCKGSSPSSEQRLEKIGNLNLAISIKGEGPILLVGHPTSGKIGYEMSLHPLEKIFTTVYYDPRGTGASEAPETLEGYSLENRVNEIEELRKKLNADKIWLFGHSDQSAVALVYALMYSQHTEGLILSGTSLVGTQIESQNRRKIAEEYRAKESKWFAQNIKDWDYSIKYNTSLNEDGKDISFSSIKWWCYNEESAQKVIPIVQEITKAGRIKAIDNRLPIETSKERDRYLEYQKKFSDLKVYTIIINGKYDTNNMPEYALELHKKLNNSELILIDKAGHFPWIENSNAFFKELNKALQKQDDFSK